jgi:hypothetical protein
MNDPETSCPQQAWGTVSGLDPELVTELRRAQEARDVRESEAIDLDALAAQAAQGDASEWRLRLARIARALGLLRD